MLFTDALFNYNVNSTGCSLAAVVQYELLSRFLSVRTDVIRGKVSQNTEYTEQDINLDPL